ncbi:hypothetical protein [Microbacterium sp.]|uniref:hypothetical protein n=1 Tax=Microbacterium sp. TaxID=51671 RepID=UPI0039E41B49
MRRAAAWIVGVGCVVAAGAVAAATPGPDAVEGPFLIRGVVGEAVTARNLVVTVEDAAFTGRLTSKDWTVGGNWLVVDLSAAAITTEVDAGLQLITLLVGGREFIASEQPPTSLVGERLRLGVDTIGAVAFELPADVDGGHAELRLTDRYSTPYLDDVIVVPLDLDDVAHEDEIEIDRPELEGMP